MSIGPIVLVATPAPPARCRRYIPLPTRNAQRATRSPAVEIRPASEFSNDPPRPLYQQRLFVFFFYLAMGHDSTPPEQEEEDRDFRKYLMNSPSGVPTGMDDMLQTEADSDTQPPRTIADFGLSKTQPPRTPASSEHASLCSGRSRCPNAICYPLFHENDYDRCIMPGG